MKRSSSSSNTIFLLRCAMVCTLQYISPIKYSFNAMIIEEFQSLTALTCTAVQQKPDGSCPFDNGLQVELY
jgi:hypothetical protein